MVAPGDTCGSCGRRVPHPKTPSTPNTKPISYRVPVDEYEAHLGVIDAVADLLGIKAEKYHRFKAISYMAAAVLQQGLRLEDEIQVDKDDDLCLRCKRPAAHTHHRKRRSQGGDDSPANLIRLCAMCHGWVHANPGAAYECGYLVQSWADPAEVEIESEIGD